MAWTVKWTTVVQAAHRVYRSTFRRKPRPPLARAHRHANAIIHLLNRYGRDSHYRPNALELWSLRLLERRLSLLYIIGRRQILLLEQRVHGGPGIDENKWREWQER